VHTCGLTIYIQFRYLYCQLSVCVLHLSETQQIVSRYKQVAGFLSF